jgi:hypothetical protein
MECWGKLPLISSKITYFWFVVTIVVDLDPHHFGNLDPHPHQIKIRTRVRIQIHIKVISGIRNLIRINLQMTSQNVTVWNLYEPI